MVVSDLAGVEDAAEHARKAHEEADALLSAQPPRALTAALAGGALGGGGDDDDDGGGGPNQKDEAALRRAKALYDEALALHSGSVGARANRALCCLFVGAPRACLDDCADARSKCALGEAIAVHQQRL